MNSPLSAPTGADDIRFPTVGDSSYVTLHYRITLASGPAAGQVFADTYTGRPATLQMGSGQWAPGLEAGLMGQREGAVLSFTVPAAQAYGERNPDLIQRVTMQMLREHAGDDQVFTPGDMVEFAAPQGGHYAGILKVLESDHAIFDFNHPLAGTDLQVEVSLLGVL